MAALTQGVGAGSTTLMTGGTSGATAAKRLTRSIDARLILRARRQTAVGESVPLDLTVSTRRAFATSVRERLGDSCCAKWSGEAEMAVRSRCLSRCVSVGNLRRHVG
jgi:hypothetical protein